MRSPSQRILCFACLALTPGIAAAQLTTNFQFSSAGAVGLGFGQGQVWTYSAFSTEIRHYAQSGAFIGSIVRPGEAANDVDIEFTQAPLVLNATPLPADTLLFINGETGVAEVYAVNTANGAVLASLTTAFGGSHVVGGAHHPLRGTLFLVQDRVPSDANQRSRIAEINPQTGAVINSFQITTVAPTFTVNFGDIEVADNGNLLVVSDDEITVAELTPTGSLVTLHTLPAGVGGLSGIGLDAGACAFWVGTPAGLVSRVAWPSGSPLCVAPCDDIDFNGDGLFPDTADIDDFLSVFSGGPCSTGTCSDIDFNNDGLFPDTTDIDALLSVFSGGGCL